MERLAKHFSQLAIGSLTTILPKPYSVAPPMAKSAVAKATAASVPSVSQ